MELLHEISDKLTLNMENGWRVVLSEHMGWDEETIELWFRVGVLPNLVRNSMENYRALLLEVEHMCAGSEFTTAAKVFIDHHSTKLRLIRTHRARTRLQLIWMTYSYLREARLNKFVSQALQVKQTEVLRGEIETLRNAPNLHRGRAAPPGNQARNSGTPPYGGPNAGQNSNPEGGQGQSVIKCAGCASKKIHPGEGRSNCPFKDYNGSVARKMAKAAEELMVTGKTKDEAIAEALAKHG